jgi:mannitol/fructose-specific phosphotransferase system IIA component (Ntr-type)
MRFADLIAPESVHIDIRSRTKETVIKSLVKRTVAIHDLNEKVVLNAVLDRERALSTGVGQGIAVPHATLKDLSKPIVALGRTKTGIDFDSIDDTQVRIVFLLLTPEGDVPLHLKMLSRISRLCQQPTLRAELLSASKPQAILDALKKAETGFQDL